MAHTAGLVVDTATAPAPRAPVTSSLSVMSPLAMSGRWVRCRTVRMILGIVPGSVSTKSALASASARSR